MWTDNRSIAVVIFLVVVAVLFIAKPVTARDTETQVPNPAQTRIETDSKTNEIRFYVDGTVAAVLKSDGLHVRKNIVFGGTVTDYGESGFESFTGNAKPTPDAGKGNADAQ